MATYPIFIDQLNTLVNLFISSEDFQNSFINKLERIGEFVQMQINWRIAINFFEKLKDVEILFENFEFTSKIYIIVMKFLNDENSNVPLKNSAIKLMPYLLKFGKKIEKEDILKFLEKEIIENKNFYKRRLYFPFFEEAIKIFSINSLMNYQIIDNVLKFFNDNKLMQSKLIKILDSIYPLILSESRIKFIINNKLDNLKKMKNGDIELSRVNIIYFIFSIYRILRSSNCGIKILLQKIVINQNIHIFL